MHHPEPKAENPEPRTQNPEPDSYLHTCGLVGRCGWGGCVWPGQIRDVDVVEVDDGGDGVRS